MRMLLVALFVLASMTIANAQSTTSTYTSLSAKACRTIKADEKIGSYDRICSGVAGYKLQLEEGDLRQNIEVITPKGEKHSLALWSVIGSGFSHLGETAEWRVANQKGKQVPVALILRYNVVTKPDSSKSTSYLAVAKITPTKICITDKISPRADANVAARKAADSSADRPCLQ